MEILSKEKKAIALGECGLDYHYNNSPANVQKEVFSKHCKLAVNLKKPLVVHTREANDDTFKILKEFIPNDWKIHVHCYTDGTEFAKKLLENFKNVYFGFTGVMTYNSAGYY